MARAVAQVGVQGRAHAQPPRVHKIFERDLWVYIAYKTSAAGMMHQRRLNEACRRLAAWVGDCTPNNGGPTATVFDRLSDKLKRPGHWLLRSLLTGDQLAAAPGTFDCTCVRIQVLMVLWGLVMAPCYHSPLFVLAPMMPSDVGSTGGRVNHPAPYGVCQRVLPCLCLSLSRF